MAMSLCLCGGLTCQTDSSVSLLLIFSNSSDPEGDAGAQGFYMRAP